MAENEGVPDPAREFLAELARILPRLGAICLLPFLEWQRALLKCYQKALEDPTFRQVAGEQAKAFAKALMASYLDFSRSEPEPGRRLVALQSDLINGYLEAVERVLRHFEEPKA
jgi:hypothetical protein